MEYDTLPSTVGSYLKLQEVYEVLDLFRQYDQNEVRENIVRDNVLAYNTSDMRSRVFSAVKRCFLKFSTNWRQKAFLDTLNVVNEDAKREILFYRLCRRSFTTYRLTLKVLFPAYKHGNEDLEKEAVMDFLETKRKTTKSASEWTDNTIEIVGSKYMTAMKKFNYLKGRQKKKINYFSPELESFTYALYDLLDRGKPPKKIITSDRLKLFMLQESDVISYLERAGNAGYVKFGQAGDVYEIHPTHEIKELPHVLE
ncbi:DUF1819 family protein [Candidatus Bipolaricaulota bacterium]|nr:DUF1819 family protein [Candidatus Bipolaricaulota bacterium]